MQCNCISFTIDKDKCKDEEAKVFHLLRRRGASLTFLGKTEWQINIPVRLPTEPFRSTLAECDFLYWIDDKAVVKEVIQSRVKIE